MTLFDQDRADAGLQQAHARFAAEARAHDAVSPARVAIGLIRAGLAISLTALRARGEVDPIALRPRVLGV